MSTETVQFWEMLSYLVTVVGLPFAIITYILGKRKERETDEEEVFERVNGSYADFLKLVIEHPDLKLRSPRPTEDLDAAQQDRLFALFEILTSVFERGYLYLYTPRMSGRKLRRWLSWEDFMREWCRREDYRERLPQLLVGEDSDFADHLRRIADEESRGD